MDMINSYKPRAHSFQFHVKTQADPKLVQLRKYVSEVNAMRKAENEDMRLKVMVKRLGGFGNNQDGYYYSVYLYDSFKTFEFFGGGYKLNLVTLG